MKETIFRHLLLVAFVGGLLLTGCKKENNSGMRLVAEKLTSDSKTYVDGTTVAWVDNDQVLINGTEHDVMADGSILGNIPQGTLLALYPSTISTASALDGSSQASVTIPNTYTYSTDNGHQILAMPMIGKATANDDALLMKHLCSALQFTVTNNLGSTLTLDNITLTGTGISGQATVTYSGDAPSVGAGNGNTVTMTFSSTTIAANGSLTVQVPLLPTASDVNVEVCGHQNIEGATGKKIYTYSRTTSVDMTRALVHRANVSITGNSGSNHMTVAASGGVFTVNSGNLRVCFSMGNLQYKNGTGWRFAEHQYDYLGTSPSATTWSTSDWVDLFGWGTWTGNNPSPLKTSQTATDYIWNNLDFNQNLYGSTAWRTLSKDEWAYLLNSRTASRVNGVDNARYAKATVNGKWGLIIFPDTYTHPSSVPAAPANINTSNAAFTGNSYSSSDWALMEDAGCVFLPAAGYRQNNSGTQYAYRNNMGYYWSSTPGNNTSTANYLFFRDNGVYPGTNGTTDNFKGHTVRLVRDL